MVELTKNRKKLLNVYDTIRPLYRLSLVFGIAPFTFPKNEYEIPKRSQIKLIYSVILFFWITLNNNILDSLINKKLPITTAKRELIVLVVVALVYLNCIIGIVILFMAIIKRNKLINFIISIQQIDYRMMKNNMKIPYMKQRSAYYKIIFALILWMTVHVVVFTANMLLRNKNFKTISSVNLASNLASTGSVLTSGITLISIFQLYFSTCLLCSRFQLLNKNFGRVLNRDFIDKMSYINVEKAVENFCDIHKELCCVSKAINSIYSITMLFMIISTFSTILSYLYLFILQIRTDLTNYTNYIDLMRHTITILINIIIVVAILKKTTSLSEEV